MVCKIYFKISWEYAHDPRPVLSPASYWSGRGLVKELYYRNHRYIGDPINIVEFLTVNPLMSCCFLISTRTKGKTRIPPIQLLRKYSRDECLVPFGIGAEYRSLIEIESILKAGAEKVCVGSAAFGHIDSSIVSEAANSSAAKSIMVSVDVKRNGSGKPEVLCQEWLVE